MPNEPKTILDTGKQHPIPKSFRTWILPLTRMHRIPVFKRVWLYLAVMAVYGASVEWLTDHELRAVQLFKELQAAAYTSVILGLLLVFRTNSAYERWWEGRKLWGQLVNESRNMCLKVKIIADANRADQMRFGELVISFAFSLKHHLRDSRPTRSVHRIDLEQTQNIPVAMAGELFKMMTVWQKSGQIDGFTRLQLDEHIKALMDILGACERIRSTPLAVSYRAFLRQGIMLNLVMLPWFVPPDIPYLCSLPIILIGSYFLIGLELIAEDIEDPFGEDGDDLPLDNICEGINNSVSEILELPKQKFTAAFKTPKIDPLKTT
ncbi:MAG TPA: bestrophin family ion channel [Drouetiella sp.]